MAKKHSTVRSSFPIRPESKIKEDKSRLIFEDLIPWMISGWVSRDFGIDASVEITKPVSHSKDQIVTGKRFSVQLKSSDTKDFERKTISTSIPKDKITYWYNSIEPVLLVLLDLDEKKAYYRWIDEELISQLFQQNPNWIAQDSTTIKFDKDIFICRQQWPEIEKNVIYWKRPTKTILSPGNYFRYSSEARGYIELLASTISECHIKYLQNELKELRQQVSQPIYTIAIVGPSRSGKSTLINALLHKEVSPVGILPTTGIPITIFPKNENATVVVFKDGSQLKGSTESSFIEDYTSQDRNPLNEKNVKLVSVNIINTLLEKGFALCDVPGLDDPDDEIRAVTKAALYHVNAIIYVIDASPMREGGFSITKQMIDDLNELGGRMERLFLVFNKTDVLDETMKGQLKSYVNSTLEKYQIKKYLPAEPFYISSKSAFQNRVGKNNPDDSVSNLENDIWTFLLGQNKTGLHKLLGSYADCKELIEKLKRIINTSLLTSEMRRKVEEEINQVSVEINELRMFVAEQKQIIFALIEKQLNDALENILLFLKKDLESVAPDAPFPEAAVILHWLETNAYNVIANLHETLRQNIFSLQFLINQWIAEKLQQVEINLENDLTFSVYQMPEIKQYTCQINPHFRNEPEGHPGILESILIGASYLFAQLVMLIDKLFSTNGRIRQKHINSILAKAKKGYNKIALDFTKNLGSYLNNICNTIETKSHDRTNVYLGELKAQLAKLDTQISEREKNEFETFLEKVLEIESGIASNFIHLKEYTDGIEWLKTRAEAHL